MSKLTSIGGIGDVTVGQLFSCGITTVEALLEAGATETGRRKIAEVSGVHPTRILKFVNHADLMRIDGVGGEHAELLQESGVRTVPDLATRDPRRLAATIAERNEDRRLVRRLPSVETVTDWVRQAKIMDRVVDH